ncbi:hypothetical protein HJC23_005100 [Cyclotella cryptica]|uniref:Uncharacterized protein n=1 Tax=Cyclotella cryptica TaxID=29204 RepID=A0ABD3QGK1_9STRA|eukprot:CCRYP_005791-RA/>CCRYP_005791-RA protein AED:0.03 eAED:0.03 QI:205/1/1/1/0.8/0.66/6/1231/1492
MEQPVLLQKLQTALACLYNTNHTNEQYRHEAHQFLLTFKSSNLRRLVVSRLQSQKDRTTNNNHNNNNSNDYSSFENDLQRHAQESSAHTIGSIYLSCFALLLASSHHCTHERIFVAQTLNHRCRSIKLVESFDIEAEDGLECGVARLVLAWEEEKRRSSYDVDADVDAGNGGRAAKSTAVLNAWGERYVPMLVHRCIDVINNNNHASLCHGGQLLGVVLERHSSSLLLGNEGEERGEERIKGNLTMLTLAVALYACAFAEYEEEYYFSQQMPQQQQQQQQHRTPWANTVLSELGSALSITALRIRYRPTQNNQDTPSSEPNVPPLVDLLIHSVHVVADAAANYFSQKQQQQQHYSQDITMQNLAQSCHIHAIKRSIAACLTSLPETVLLPPGSDRGEDNHRIPSIDRACLRAASLELRSGNGEGAAEGGMGMERMWMEIVKSELGENANQTEDVAQAMARLDDASACRILECCESWARFVWVPLHVIDVTIGKLALRYLSVWQDDSPAKLSMQYQKAQNCAFQYLVSIFEGASPSLTVEDILSATLGVAAGKSGGGTAKKKQGNKSKKRQERRLERASEKVDVAEPACSAEEELLRRKYSASVAAAAVLGVSVHEDGLPREDATFGLRSAASTPSTSTHGICSTVSILATSVSPHLLWLERNANEDYRPSEKWWLKLFSLILESVRRLCQSINRDIRALAYEPLMILHESLNSTPVVRLRMEQIAVDAVCECALALSVSCRYPDDYFLDLAVDNDEDLEFERNDVRDVVRSVSSLDSGNFGTAEYKSPSMLILEHLVKSCNKSIQESTQHNLLPPESVVHTLSALAKPLNKLGTKYAGQPTQNERQIIMVSVIALGSVCDRLNQSFHSESISQILPVSRLALMGLSSLSPLCSSLVDVKLRFATSDAEKELISAFDHTIKVALQHAIISSAKIPELVAESTLKITRYDIRGAMRGPGGEDHVGCIALMRLCFESDNLACSMLSIYGSSLLCDLASLHQELKTLENNRPPGREDGIGVAPISRRLVLRTISRLCMLQTKTSGDESGRVILHQLLRVPLSEIRVQKELPLTRDKLLRVCESTFDLASFNSFVIADLFNNPSGELGCVFECVLSGYSRLSFSADSDPWFEQWARLRGAALCLLRTCFNQSVTEYSANVASAVIRAECDAAVHQCDQGPTSGSTIFIDNVVGEEVLHAGAFFMAIKDNLHRIDSNLNTSFEEAFAELRRCLAIMKSSAVAVNSLLLNKASEATSHTDPRPTVAEAWFLAMTSLVSIFRGANLTSQLTSTDRIEDMIGDSLHVSIALIFMKDLGNKKSPPPTVQNGMSLDGPQTLAMMDFMSEAILLGSGILAATARSFTTHFKLVQLIPSEELGATIIAAGLLRAASGALPPWAVELTPLLIRSMFTALGNNCDTFIQTLKNSTKIECSGHILAGRYFEHVSSVHIDSFLSKTRDACNRGEWNKLKSVLKSACGGKKKDSGFNLKPQYTCWKCERL